MIAQRLNCSSKVDESLRDQIHHIGKGMAEAAKTTVGCSTVFVSAMGLVVAGIPAACDLVLNGFGQGLLKATVSLMDLASLGGFSLGFVGGGIGTYLIGRISAAATRSEPAPTQGNSTSMSSFFPSEGVPLSMAKGMALGTVLSILQGTSLGLVGAEIAEGAIGPVRTQIKIEMRGRKPPKGMPMAISAGKSPMGERRLVSVFRGEELARLPAAGRAPDNREGVQNSGAVMLVTLPS